MNARIRLWLNCTRLFKNIGNYTTSYNIVQEDNYSGSSVDSKDSANNRKLALYLAPNSMQHKSYSPSNTSILRTLSTESNLYITRSLKPENVLIDKKGYIKLIDFGLSCNMNSLEHVDPIAGTPEYLSPEIFQSGFNVSPAIDWWTLGNLIF